MLAQRTRATVYKKKIEELTASNEEQEALLGAEKLRHAQLGDVAAQLKEKYKAQGA